MEKNERKRIILTTTEKEFSLLEEIREKEGHFSLQDVLRHCVRFYYQKMYHNKNKYIRSGEISTAKKREIELVRIKSLPPQDMCKEFYGPDAVFLELPGDVERCYERHPDDPNGAGNTAPYDVAIERLLNRNT